MLLKRRKKRPANRAIDRMLDAAYEAKGIPRPTHDELLDQTVSPLTGRANHYRLVGQTAVPCSLREWSASFSREDRRVRLTFVGPYEVSTVFLGLDYAWEGPPMIFETMTFLRRDMDGNCTEADNECDGRYSTWEEAERGHQRAVDFLKTTRCAPGDPVEEIVESDQIKSEEQ